MLTCQFVILRFHFGALGLCALHPDYPNPVASLARLPEHAPDWMGTKIYMYTMILTEIITDMHLTK